jgi:hypothetical protein
MKIFVNNNIINLEPYVLLIKKAGYKCDFNVY